MVVPESPGIKPHKSKLSLVIRDLSRAYFLISLSTKEGPSIASMMAIVPTVNDKHKHNFYFLVLIFNTKNYFNCILK